MRGHSHNKIKKAEMYDLRFSSKVDTGQRQLMLEEAARMDDIIEVLGQQLENQGIWLHPNDRPAIPPRMFSTVVARPPLSPLSILSFCYLSPLSSFILSS